MHVCKKILIFVIICITTTTDAAKPDLQKINVIGYLEKRIQAAEWGALHMSAAAACQGLAVDGGVGPHSNRVLVKNPKITCQHTCKKHGYQCNAHVSINGALGKATRYEQEIGSFYNYGCKSNGHFLEEVKSGKDFGRIQAKWNYYHYCCCRHLEKYSNTKSL